MGVGLGRLRVAGARTGCLRVLAGGLEADGGLTLPGARDVTGDRDVLGGRTPVGRRELVGGRDIAGGRPVSVRPAPVLAGGVLVGARRLSVGRFVSVLARSGTTALPGIALLGLRCGDGTARLGGRTASLYAAVARGGAGRVLTIGRQGAPTTLAVTP